MAGPTMPRVGVAGAGSLGRHHVRILRDLAGDRFAGFHDANATRAAEIAGELGVRAFASLDELLSSVDALSIVTPTPAHHAVGAAALRAGKHLFVEKPLAATRDEAAELLELAGAAGVVVQTGHVERFNRAIRAALPFIDQPQFIESDRLAPFNPRGSDVAVVLDLMIHDIDLVLSLVGCDVTELSAVGVPVLTPEVDIANARLVFATGAVANITASRVSRERMRKIRIFQPSGYVSLDLASGTGEFFRLRGGLDLAALASAPQSLEAFVERVELVAPEAEPLRLELEGWLAAIRGEAPVVVTGEDGARALDVALRIMDAIGATAARARLARAAGAAGASSRA